MVAVVVVVIYCCSKIIYQIQILSSSLTLLLLQFQELLGWSQYLDLVELTAFSILTARKSSFSKQPFMV